MKKLQLLVHRKWFDKEHENQNLNDLKTENIPSRLKKGLFFFFCFPIPIPSSSCCS